MPSDDFQQLVYLIQRQLKTRPDAVVSESKRLTNRNTGKRREVDVVVEFTESGARFLLALECQRRSRKPDIEWVEQMLKKHERLSDKLVLVASRPLTADALDEARRHGVETIQLSDALQTDWPAFIDQFTDLYFANFEFTLLDWTVLYGPGPPFDPRQPIVATQGTMRAELAAMIGTVLRNYDVFAKPAMDLWSKLPVDERKNEHRINGDFNVPDGAPPLILTQGALEYPALHVWVVIGARIATAPLVMTGVDYNGTRVAHGTATLGDQKVRLVMTEQQGGQPRAELAFIDGRKPQPRTVELQLEPQSDPKPGEGR